MDLRVGLDRGRCGIPGSIPGGLTNRLECGHPESSAHPSLHQYVRCSFFVFILCVFHVLDYSVGIVFMFIVAHSLFVFWFTSFARVHDPVTIPVLPMQFSSIAL